MKVNLTPELEDLVRRKVDSGLYNNPSEVVREALRLLAAQDRLRDAHLRSLLVPLAPAEPAEAAGAAEIVAESRKKLRKRRRSTKKRG